MVDHYKLGREVILAASEAELEILQKAEKPRHTSPYGATTDVYDVALRRIGEVDLANELKDPNQQIEDVVQRISSYESILTSIIANVCRGNHELSQSIEQSQRDLFYLEGAGYWDPHWKSENMMERRETVRDQIIERQSPKLGVYEKIREYEGAGGEMKAVVEGFQLGNVSASEAIFAIAGNLVLGDEAHAKKVVDDLFNLYMDGDLFISEFARSEMTTAASICKLSAILGDTRGEDLFRKRNLHSEYGKKGGISHFDSPEGCAGLLYALDYFGDVNEAEEIRDEISLVDLVKNKEVTTEVDQHHVGYGPKENIKLLKLGLALTGLGEEKPFLYYTPDPRS